MIVPWRLVVDGADDGAWNMAVDEALLESYERDDAPPGPTLRLYGFNPATISLGRAQREAGSHDRGLALAEGIGLVRRPSGGTLVLHEFERTYAVIGRLRRPPFLSGVTEAYRAIAGALTNGLRRLGVKASAAEPRPGSHGRAGAVCFERVGAWEIEAAGRKLVGSAQVRRRTAVLQHGSIPMRLDPARLSTVLGRPVDGSAFTDLVRAAGRAVDGAELDAACIAGFEESFGAKLLPGALGEAEALRAAELRCWKYDSMAWTKSGTIGARESRWGPVLTR